MRLDYDRTALPCLIEWQCLQSGLYVLGIEPSTNHLLGRSFAEARGELIELQHGEVRRYRTRLGVLDGGEADRRGARRDSGAPRAARGFCAGERGLAGAERAVMSEIRCLADLRAQVGEGPSWDDRAGVLWWVDIKGQRLFRFDPASGENRAWAMPERIGCVVAARRQAA